jgi:23S rRNA pseudouridine2605 synthase
LNPHRPPKPLPPKQKSATNPKKPAPEPAVNPATAAVNPATAAADPRGERLQKLLAAAGLGSRREIESWIEAGRVSVGGAISKLGDRALPGAEIAVDGKVVSFSTANRPRVLLYHKPVGEVVTRSDPGGRPTVFSRLPPGRWVAVGRLDINSAGLLLFTDSGELANRLMHPRYEIEREYEARVQGRLSPDVLEKLRTGVQLEDGPASFSSIAPAREREGAGANHWYRVSLHEGRNREVRRLFEAVGARVNRLTRVRYGPVELPRDLLPGRWLELSSGRVPGLLANEKGVKLQKL